MNFTNPQHHNGSTDPSEIPAYTSSYPKDFSQIGTIVGSYLWRELVRTGNHKKLGPTIHKNYPTKNPVWNHKLEIEKEELSDHISDYSLANCGYDLIVENDKIYTVNYEPYTLILIETSEENFEIIHYPSKEIRMLRGVTENDFEIGHRVGVIKYPTSRDYDFWLVHEPSQYVIDGIDRTYDLSL